MAEVELSHWWYRSLHALVLDTLEQFGLDADCRIIDAGCGTGGLLVRLGEAGYRAQGFDFSPLAVECCRGRGATAEVRSICDLEACVAAGSVSVFVCNDVLYHLSSQERLETLASWRRLLVARGKLILNVPTGKQFQGTHDLSVGIRERIRHDQLKTELAHAGYDVLSRRYWPFLLSPLILAVRRLQRRRLKHGAVVIRSDIDLPTPLVNRGLYVLTRLEQRLPIGHFGSSLFVVAQAR